MVEAVLEIIIHCNLVTERMLVQIKLLILKYSSFKLNTLVINQPELLIKESKVKMLNLLLTELLIRGHQVNKCTIKTALQVKSRMLVGSRLMTRVISPNTCSKIVYLTLFRTKEV